MNTIAVLHCSSDVNYFIQGEFSTTIPYQDLERELPRFLVSRMRSDPFETIVVINGPGGFSQLRIACLCINLLKSHYPDLCIATWTKVQLAQEFHTQGVLPQYQIMHVGMKKKLWMVDLSEGTHSDKTVTSLIEDLGAQVENISVDMMDDHLLLQELPQLRSSMIQYQLQEIGLVCTYQEKLGVIPRQQLVASEHLTDYLEPEYMIAPQIG